MQVTPNPILYINSTKTTILYDIPASFALAHGIHKQDQGDSSLLVPYASAPPLKPYAATEPKSSKAAARVKERLERSPNDCLFPLATLQDAVSEIKENYVQDGGAWCLPRALWPDGAKDAAPFKLAQHETGHDDHKPTGSELTNLSVNTANTFEPRQIWNQAILNAHTEAVRLTVPIIDSHFHIPAQASFLCGKIGTSTALAFSFAAMQRYPHSSQATSAGSGEFDLMILDPPWPNRSVLRSKKYKTNRLESDWVDALKDVLCRHVAEDGYVMCWITHKGAVRETALDLFAAANVELIEEWAWLKVAAEGSPVMPINGTWRRPFEIFLLGKKIREREKELVRRVVVAVPDAHSRKPSLLPLLHLLWPEHYRDRRVLEVFARNLTEGWFAWGDEVLKFNDLRAFQARHDS